jgi:hypothetical protein
MLLEFSARLKWRKCCQWNQYNVFGRHANKKWWGDNGNYLTTGLLGVIEGADRFTSVESEKLELIDVPGICCG